MKNQNIRKLLTINFLLVFIGIIFSLSYTKPCFAQSQKTTETYKSLIQQADQAFSAKDYESALPFYEKANQVQPEYNYASEKISEIKKILEANPDSIAQISSQSKNSNASYKTLIAQADYTLAARDYPGALLLYDKAYQTKPDYNYASEKIDEINSMLNASPDTKAQLFETTIRKAESFYEQKNYQQAKSEYQKASLVDTSAKLPKDRLGQISAVYTDPDDMANFNVAIASGDKALANSDFDHAIVFYEAALELHPSSKYVSKKITDAKKQKEQAAITVASADKLLQSEKPTEARTENQKTSDVTPDNQNVKEITTVAVINANTNKALPDNYDKTIEQKDQNKYDAALASAENHLKLADYDAALTGFKSASAIKPTESYPKQKITEVEGLIAARKTKDENYASAIKSGDQLLSALKYNEALNAYKQALSLKPNEAYPISKTAEINSILAKQKSDSENYAQAIRTGEKALAAGNLSLALTSFQDAQKIKPSETYPMEQITEIKATTANQQNKDEKYRAAIKTGDQLFAGKEYSGALTAYTEAFQLKKNEKYPQDQIDKINKMLIDSRSVDINYNIAITDGDKLFEMKDYSGANSAYAKASVIKPSESYPKQRMIEINKIFEGIALTRSAEYNKALEAADKLYNKKVFDQAVDAYETASKMNPSDVYPELQIGKIRKYMSEHAILDLFSQSQIISAGNEKKFTFSAIDPSLRKNNYILLKARSTGKSAPKVYLNYGRDDAKNGGIVLRNLDKSTLSDFLVSISIQDKWFREENNWISISVETGEIEITKVQISAGE